MIFSKLKLYAFAALAAVIAFLGGALKLKSAQYKKQKKKATDAQARVDHAEKVITHDVEIDVQEDMHLAEVANGSSDELTHSNSWD